MARIKKAGYKTATIRNQKWKFYGLDLSPDDEAANFLKVSKSWTGKRIPKVSDKVFYQMVGDVGKFAAYCVQHPKQAKYHLSRSVSWLSDAVLFAGLTKNPLALNDYAQTTKRQARLLNKFREARPRDFEFLMLLNPDWPVIYSPFPDYATDTSILKKKLRHPSFNLWGKGTKRKKPISFQTPSNDLARRVEECLSNNAGLGFKWKLWPQGTCPQKKLPDWLEECRQLYIFSTDTVDKWIETGWKCILWHCDGHPENHPKLSAIGKSRGKKAPAGSKSESAHVRAGIREEFAEAMIRLSKEADNRTVAEAVAEAKSATP